MVDVAAATLAWSERERAWPHVAWRDPARFMALWSGVMRWRVRNSSKTVTIARVTTKYDKDGDTTKEK